MRSYHFPSELFTSRLGGARAVVGTELVGRHWENSPESYLRQSRTHYRRAENTQSPLEYNLDTLLREVTRRLGTFRKRALPLLFVIITCSSMTKGRSLSYPPPQHHISVWAHQGWGRKETARIVGRFNPFTVYQLAADFDASSFHIYCVRREIAFLLTYFYSYSAHQSTCM